MSDDFIFSKKGQRHLSSFVGRELIYDYFVGSLDDERRKAVEDFLKENPEAHLDFQKIRNGIEYAELLKKITVSEPLFDKVWAPASIVQIIVRKIRFDEWHPALRGGFEASIVALGVAIAAVLIPWHELMEIKISDRDIVLTEVARNETRPRGSEQEVATKEQEIFPDDGDLVTSPAVTASAATAPETVTSTTLLKVAEVKSQAPPTTLPQTTAVERAGKAEEAIGDAKLGGFLYRGELVLVNPQAVAPKLAEKIGELGGRKAGEVELGWNRGSGSYFHFTIPENKYEELLDILDEYGQLKIHKERHGRIMPKGIIRLIITAEDKK
jgi:hypothetical protein